MWNVKVCNGESDFLQVLFVLKSVDVVGTADVEWIAVWIVGTGDDAAGFTLAEYHLVTLCIRHIDTYTQTVREK